EDAPVGVAQLVRLGRLRRDGSRFRSGAFDAIQPAVVEVRAIHNTVVAKPRAAAVLMDTRAHVEALRNDVDRVFAALGEYERHPPLLLGTALEPVHAFVVRREIAVSHT